MSSTIKIEKEEQLVGDNNYLSIQVDQKETPSDGKIQELGGEEHGGICAICFNKIALQDIALIKGCEHAYCLQCILQWATYCQNPTCPQCKQPFDSLNVHRSLDGSIHDYMFEESVCLLVRASWFSPMPAVNSSDTYDDPSSDTYNDPQHYYPYEFEVEVEDEDEYDDLDEVYHSSSSLRIGNRRWGDNGYVRAGRIEARPVCRSNVQDSASSSHEPKKKEEKTGRRAKRALKREAADKRAALKHEEHLARFGRK